MCLAIPMELKKIDGDWGIIEHDGHEHKVSLALIDSPKKGDWLLAHGELAVSRITAAEAHDILGLIKSSGHVHTHA